MDCPLGAAAEGGAAAATTMHVRGLHHCKGLTCQPWILARVLRMQGLALLTR